MNFQFYLEKLFDSEAFKEFRKENPDAFLCSGFFTLDKEGSDNQQHLDYWIPSSKKLFSFKLNEDPIEMVPTETYKDPEGNEFDPEKINDNIQFDMEKIEKLVVEKALEEKINNKIQKLILSLQRKNGKDFLLGTAFLSNLGLLKVMIDIDKNEITDFEKKSFFDMMKFIGKKKD